MCLVVGPGNSGDFPLCYAKARPNNCRESIVPGGLEQWNPGNVKRQADVCQLAIRSQSTGDVHNYRQVSARESNRSDSPVRTFVLPVPDFQRLLKIRPIHWH